MFNFLISLPKLGYLSEKKGNLKFLDLKMGERGIRKCLTFVIHQIASKILGKIILKPL